MACRMPELPAYAAAVLRALEDAGFEAWVVGGWVRDALLGSASHDVDVCTAAPWQESERALLAAGLAVHRTGTQHGTVTAVSEGKPVEVTTYRVDGAYSDARHPDSVRFVRDVREDLARRDFTINAMAFHPARGLLDPFGGREDLARGLIRAVGDPRLRFGEDALRVLRAVRFACRMGFSVEPRTQEALAACAPELAHVARERGRLARHRAVGGERADYLPAVHERDAHEGKRLVRAARPGAVEEAPVLPHVAHYLRPARLRDKTRDALAQPVASESSLLGVESARRRHYLEFVALEERKRPAQHTHAALENLKCVFEQAADVSFARDGGGDLAEDGYLRLDAFVSFF